VTYAEAERLTHKYVAWKDIPLGERKVVRERVAKGLEEQDVRQRDVLNDLMQWRMPKTMLPCSYPYTSYY